MIKPSLKKQKISTYIFFSFWVTLSALILIESAMPDNMSSTQSNFVANIFQKILPDDKFSQEVAPTSFTPTTSDIVLNANDGKTNLVIGTSTTYNFKLEYPSLADNQYKKDTFKIEKNDPDSSFNVNENLVNLGSDNYQMSITSLKKSKDLSVTISFSDSLKYELNFDICPRFFPNNDVLKSLSDKNISLAKNESYQIQLGLLRDGVVDELLSPRYYDLSNASRSSSNEEIATINSQGIVTGIKEGEATISYGPYKYNVKVSSSSMAVPTNSFEYEQNGDFLAIDDVNHLNGGQAFTFSFNEANIDDSFDFELVGNDIDCSALLLRKSKNSCIVKGIFEEKDVSLLVKSTINKKISKTIPLSFGNVKPVGINGVTVNGAPTYIDEDGNLNVSVPIEKDLTIRGLFLGNDRTVSLSEENINIVLEGRNITVSKNDTLDCSLKFANLGDFEGTISSLSDPSLKLKVKFTTYDSRTNALKEFLTLVRKSIGHFSLFMVEAIFMFLFLFNDTKDKYMIFTSLTTISYNFVIGGFSELIQYFTPGRTCTWVDVGIDTLGATFGTVLCLLVIGVIILVKYLKNKKRG